MKLKLTLGVLLLIFLVAFSCTTKKPSQFDEVTIFRGKVVDNVGKPVEYALIQLLFPVGQNCTCVSDSIINCVSSYLASTIQPTNVRGEYQIDLDWDLFGFLFDESSPCQMYYNLAVGTLQVIGNDTSFVAVADTFFPFSIQDRSVPQVFDFQLP